MTLALAPILFPTARITEPPAALARIENALPSVRAHVGGIVKKSEKKC